MTNTELILNILAEVSTKDLSQATDPETLEESLKVTKQGGTVAREELELRTGKKVVSPVNAKKTLRIDHKEPPKNEK